MLSSLISTALTPYRSDPRVGKYITAGTPTGVPAICRLPHPKYGFTFPPENVKISGVEIVHILLPSSGSALLNHEGSFCQEQQIWVKAWLASEEIADAITCELFRSLSPHALSISQHPAVERFGTPNASCVHLKSWSLIR